MTPTNDAPVTVEQSLCLTPGCRYSTEIKTHYAHSSYGNARVGVTALFPEWKGLKASTGENLKHIEEILHRHMEAAVAEIGQYDLTIGGTIAKDWPLPHRLAALASAPAGDGADDEITIDHGTANSHVFDDRIVSREEGCIAFASEPWSSRIAAALARPRAAVGEDFLSQLRRVNTDRYHAWVGDGQDAGILFDAAELGGEVGELLNVVKKLEREDRGWRGSRAAPEDFADECADVLICLDKLARRKGVDLVAATVAKFNATSAKVDLPHRLALQSPPAKVEG